MQQLFNFKLFIVNNYLVLSFVSEIIFDYVYIAHFFFFFNFKCTLYNVYPKVLLLTVFSKYWSLFHVALVTSIEILLYI